jgi:hypothetical protein
MEKTDVCSSQFFQSGDVNIDKVHIGAARAWCGASSAIAGPYDTFDKPSVSSCQPL